MNIHSMRNMLGFLNFTMHQIQYFMILFFILFGFFKYSYYVMVFF